MGGRCLQPAAQAALYISAWTSLIIFTGAALATASTQAWTEVMLNGRSLGEGLVMRSADRAGLWLEYSIIEALPALAETVGVVRDVDGQIFVALDSLKALAYEHDPSSQQLAIKIDPRHLPPQVVQARRQPAPPLSQSGRGALMRYDIFSRRGLDGGTQKQSAALFELRHFDPHGSLSNRVLWSDAPGQSLLRLDSVWRRDLPGWGAQLDIGDHQSAEDALGRRSLTGGISLRRAFEFRPLEPTYPVPTLSGSAALPSTVDLYINQIRQQSFAVEPGPFQLQQPVLLTGQGVAELVVRNVLGENTVLRQDFFVVPALLRPGLWDYQLSLGALREGYGERSHDYQDLQFSLRARRGISDRLTIHGSVRAQSNAERVADVGALWRVPRLPLSLHLAVGAHRLATEAAGGLWRAGLSWQRGRWYADIDHRQAQLTTAAETSALPYRVQQLARAGARFGPWNLSLNGLRRDRPGKEQFRNLTLRLSRRVPGWQGGHVALESYQQQLDAQRPDRGLRLSMVWSPRPRDHLSARINTEQQGGWEYRHQRRGELGDSWVVQGFQSDTGQRSYALGSDVNTTAVAARARLDESDAGTALALGLRGSAGVIEGRFFIGREPGDAFAVIDLSGLADVTIYRNQQAVARTDTNGRALVAGLRPYQANNLRLEATEVPLHWSLPRADLTVWPRSGSGVLVDFQARAGVSARFQLYQGPGRVVPAGARVRLERQPGEQRVATAGRAWWPGLAAGDHRGQADWAGQSCEFELRIPETAADQAQLGALPCR